LDGCDLRHADNQRCLDLSGRKLGERKVDTNSNRTRALPKSRARQVCLGKCLPKRGLLTSSSGAFD
jgi:hypothetical protein